MGGEEQKPIVGDGIWCDLQSLHAVFRRDGALRFELHGAEQFIADGMTHRLAGLGDGFGDGHLLGLRGRMVVLKTRDIVHLCILPHLLRFDRQTFAYNRYVYIVK
jgi:hypothetical protein